MRSIESYVAIRPVNRFSTIESFKQAYPTGYPHKQPIEYQLGQETLISILAAEEFLISIIESTKKSYKSRLDLDVDVKGYLVEYPLPKLLPASPRGYRELIRMPYWYRESGVGHCDICNNDFNFLSIMPKCWSSGTGRLEYCCPICGAVNTPPAFVPVKQVKAPINEIRNYAFIYVPQDVPPLPPLPPSVDCSDESNLAKAANIIKSVWDGIEGLLAFSTVPVGIGIAIQLEGVKRVARWVLDNNFDRKDTRGVPFESIANWDCKWYQAICIAKRTIAWVGLKAEEWTLRIWERIRNIIAKDVPGFSAIMGDQIASLRFPLDFMRIWTLMMICAPLGLQYVICFGKDPDQSFQEARDEFWDLLKDKLASLVNFFITRLKQIPSLRFPKDFLILGACVVNPLLWYIGDKYLIATTSGRDEFIIGIIDRTKQLLNLKEQQYTSADKEAWTQLAEASYNYDSELAKGVKDAFSGATLSGLSGFLKNPVGEIRQIRQTKGYGYVSNLGKSVFSWLWDAICLFFRTLTQGIGALFSFQKMSTANWESLRFPGDFIAMYFIIGSSCIIGALIGGIESVGLLAVPGAIIGAIIGCVIALAFSLSTPENRSRILRLIILADIIAAVIATLLATGVGSAIGSFFKFIWTSVIPAIWKGLTDAFKDIFPSPDDWKPPEDREAECIAAGKYWYDNACHDEPKTDLAGILGKVLPFLIFGGVVAGGYMIYEKYKGQKSLA